MSMRKWRELSAKLYEKQQAMGRHRQMTDLNIDTLGLIESLEASKILPLSLASDEESHFWNINMGSSAIFSEDYCREPTSAAYINKSWALEKKGPIPKKLYLILSNELCSWKADLVENLSADQQVNLGVDPFSLGLWESKVYRCQLQPKFLKHPQVSHYFRLSGLAYAMAGATPVQQLAILLSSLLQLKENYSQHTSPSELFAKTSFELALDSHHFLGAAQVKALQTLLARIGEIEDCQWSPDIFVIHSPRWLARREPWNNLMRLTSVNMAARVSGARGVVQLPYDCLLEGGAQRISRNIDLILTKESHLGKVSDPYLGSPSFEVLVEKLCQQSWKLFCELQSKGGLLASLRAGWLQEEVGRAEKQEKEDFLFAKKKMVGVNDYVLDQPLSDKHPLGDESRAIDLETWWLNYQSSEDEKVKDCDVRKLTPRLLAEKFESWQFYTDRIRKQDPASVQLGLWLEPGLGPSPRFKIAKKRLQSLGFSLSENTQNPKAVLTVAADPIGPFVSEKKKSFADSSRPYLIWAGEKSIDGFDSFLGASTQLSEFFDELKKIYGKD